MISGNTLVYDDALFRAQIPAYADVTKYPEATLQAWWNTAISYISPTQTLNWWEVGQTAGNDNTPQQLAINLMTAHLIFISGLIANGKASPGGGIVSSATIDKITVSTVPPPVKSQWQWWLSQSPYGANLLALLSLKSTGGFYIGGRPELAAFRRVGGCF